MLSTVIVKQAERILHICFLPGLEGEVVGDVGLWIKQGLLVTLPMNELTLSESQTPFLYMKDDWIWQMALHDKQWTENHLKQFHSHKYQRWVVQNNWCTSQITYHSLLHVGVGFECNECAPHIQQRTTGTRHLAETTSGYSGHHIHSHLRIRVILLTISLCK